MGVSNKSLFTLIKELQARVDALEKQVAVLPEAYKQLLDSYLLASKPLDNIKVAETAERINAAPSRKMCPKCNAAPGYFFHVKHCRGKAV